MKLKGTGKVIGYLKKRLGRNYERSIVWERWTKKSSLELFFQLKKEFYETIRKKSTVKLGVQLELVHLIKTSRNRKLHFMSLGIYIQFSSEQKKRQVVGILKK